MKTKDLPDWVIEEWGLEKVSKEEEIQRDKQLESKFGQAVEKLDGTVNREFLLMGMVTSGFFTRDEAKYYCELHNLDYEKLKLYLLFS